VAWWTAALGVETARRKEDRELEQQLLAALRTPMEWYASASPYDLQPVADHIRFCRNWLDHPPSDPYWTRWSIESLYSRITVPALHFGGWYDIFNEGTIKNFVNLTRLQSDEGGDRQQLLVGPWWHVVLRRPSP